MSRICLWTMGLIGAFLIGIGAEIAKDISNISPPVIAVGIAILIGCIIELCVKIDNCNITIINDDDDDVEY